MPVSQQFAKTTSAEVQRSAEKHIAEVAVRENGSCFISPEELACQVTAEQPIAPGEEYESLLRIVGQVIDHFFKSVGQF